VEESGFVATAYYASLGFAVPGALGAGLARPDRRPFVIVGDGAFQMTGLELGGMARVGVHPIVVVVNNDGYGTERPMMDGAFNDIPRMRYSRFPEALGSGTGVRVDTEDGLDAALREALADATQLRLIEAVIPRDDISPMLSALTAELGKRVARQG
jgi:indolepyruvate decarboxylase